MKTSQKILLLMAVLMAGFVILTWGGCRIYFSGMLNRTGAISFNAVYSAAKVIDAYLNGAAGVLPCAKPGLQKLLEEGGNNADADSYVEAIRQENTINRVNGLVRVYFVPSPTDDSLSADLPAWYSAVQGSEPAAEQLCFYTSSGDIAGVTMANPVYITDGSGKYVLKGILAADFSLDTINETAKDAALLLDMEDSRTVIFNSDSSVIYDSIISTDNDNMYLPAVRAFLKADAGVNTIALTDASGATLDMTVCHAPLGIGGMLMIAYPAKSVIMSILYGTLPLITVAFIVLLVCIAACFVIIRSITHPLKSLSSELNSMAEEVSIKDIFEDEIESRLEKKLVAQDDVKSISEAVSALQESLSDISQSLLTETANASASALSLQKLTQETDSASADLRKNMEELVNSASRHHKTAQESADAAADIASKFAEAAKNTKSSSDVSGTASGISKKIRGEIDELNATLSKISESSDAEWKKMSQINENVAIISKFISALSEVAEQAVQLSLDTVQEALQAGLATHGFAAVMQKIREQKEKITTVAHEVNSRLGALNSDIDTSMHSVQGYGIALHETSKQIKQAQRESVNMGELTGRLNKSIGEIASALAQQEKNGDMLKRSVASLREQSDELTVKIRGAVKELETIRNSCKNSVNEAGVIAAISKRLQSLTERFKL